MDRDLFPLTYLRRAHPSGRAAFSFPAGLAWLFGWPGFLPYASRLDSIVALKDLGSAGYRC